MSRAIAIMAVLSLSATAFAAPMYEVQNVQLVAGHAALGGADVLMFDVVLVSQGELKLPGDPGYTAADALTGFGGAAALSGPAASNFTGNANYNRLKGSYWQAVIGVDGTYQFAGLKGQDFPNDAGVVASNAAVSADGNTLTHAMVAEYGNPLEGVAPVVGNVLARFVFEYTGTPDLGQLTILIHEDGMSTEGVPLGLANKAYLLTNAGRFDMDLVPEPATMGLLGLGLLGMVIRRKK